jgi:hypothetical protein
LIPGLNHPHRSLAPELRTESKRVRTYSYAERKGSEPGLNPFDPEKVIIMSPECTPGNSAIQ